MLFLWNQNLLIVIKPWTPIPEEDPLCSAFLEWNLISTLAFGGRERYWSVLTHVTSPAVCTCRRLPFFILKFGLVASKIFVSPLVVSTGSPFKQIWRTTGWDVKIATHTLRNYGNRKKNDFLFYKEIKKKWSSLWR